MRVVSNHDWSAARSVVLKRDGHRCVVCGEDDKGDRAREYHRRCGKTFIEVNHIRPVNGRRKNWDCQNHQDNLEALCHDCHGAVTKQQRDAGLIGGRLPHLFKVRLVRETKIAICEKCGAAATGIALERATVGRRVWPADRMREVCKGATLKSRKRLRPRRARR